MRAPVGLRNGGDLLEQALRVEVEGETDELAV
jgi:hypothetical protein